MKLYKEDSEALPAYQILPDADPAPSGFTIVTDIVEASIHSLKKIDSDTEGFRDKLSYREFIKGLVYTKMGVAVHADAANQAKWDLLSPDEKEIACDLFLVGVESFFLGVTNDIKVWDMKAAVYRCWTMEARQERSELAEAIVFNRMVDKADAKQALADLTQIALDTVIDIDDVSKKLQSKVRVKRLNRQYVEGLEDEEHDGVIAVRDWISSTAGTPYASNGFMNLGYDLTGSHTYENVRDDMIAALDGTY